MSNFQTYRLGDVCSVINGRAYAQDELLDEGKYKVLRVGNFFTSSSWYYSDFELEPEKYCDFGDLLFAWSASFGPRIWNEGKTIYHYHIWKLVPDEKIINKKYLFYLLHNRTKSMLGSTHGSTMLHLTKTFMEDLKITVPLYASEQQKIAAVLSALDAKIELNQRINAELEAMAKFVFRYWFVENKERVNWEIGTLGDVAENIRRSANPNEIRPETHYIGLEHMPRKSIALAEYGNATELESNKYSFKTGEFLFGKLRPYFHKVGIAPVDGVCSTDILVIAPKSSEWYGFVLGHISSDEIIKYADATSGGTKMPRTNWESLARFEIGIPPVELAEKFSEFFIPIADQIRTNILESQTLTELRDWLLPMLMNGQVKVG